MSILCRCYGASRPLLPTRRTNLMRQKLGSLSQLATRTSPASHLVALLLRCSLTNCFRRSSSILSSTTNLSETLEPAPKTFSRSVTYRSLFARLLSMTPVCGAQLSTSTAYPRPGSPLSFREHVSSPSSSRLMTMEPFLKPSKTSSPFPFIASLHFTCESKTGRRAL